MLRACYLLRDTVNKIGRMGKTLSINSDLDVLKNRLRFEYRNAQVFFQELLCCVEDCYELDSSYNEFIEMVDAILKEEDWSIIKQDLETLPDHILTSYIEQLSINDLSLRARKQYYEYNDTILSDNDLRQLGRSFRTQTNRPVNFLDARCKNGYYSSEMRKYSMEKINFYGMEKDTSLANIAKDKEIFEKIAKGGLNGAKCSNDVFDVTFLVPTLEFEANLTPMNTLRPRKEVEEFRQVTKYLREDGLLLMVIPYYRLTSQFCTLIAKNYNNVSIGATEEWTDLLIIAGTKKADSSEPDEDIYNLLRQASLVRPIGISSEQREQRQLKEYILPPDLLEISIFRGNVLDDDDILDIINDSNLYESFMGKQTNILESTEDQQPLLPFNIGQIGLVLTSGCLDGEIEELDGQYHVIKGMVKKDIITEEVPTEKRGDKEVRTTHINKVQINVITPDGTIKTLA